MDRVMEMWTLPSRIRRMQEPQEQGIACTNVITLQILANLKRDRKGTSEILGKTGYAGRSY